MKSIRILVALIVALALIGVPPVSAASDTKKTVTAKGKAALYIVRMVDAPVVAYEGGVAGISATAPAQGKKVNPNSSNVQRYVVHLKSRHDAALNAVGAGSAKVYDYYYSF